MQSDKVKHVLAAGQTRAHSCHWPGCQVQCPPARWGCRQHWYILPGAIRLEIWRSYRIGQENGQRVSPEYLEAVTNAQQWIIENHPDRGQLAAARMREFLAAGCDDDCMAGVKISPKRRTPLSPEITGKPQADLFK